jgi:hypothetical protein
MTPEVTNQLDVNRIKDMFADVHKFRNGLVKSAEDARKKRRYLVDIDAARAKGVLMEHETLIAQRVIDENISMDIPSHLNYLMTSQRLAIFVPRSPLPEGKSVDMVESEFARAVRYPNWIVDYIRWCDGAILHGKDYLELIHDPFMSGAVRVEHVGFENLLFDQSVEDIQACPMVARVYAVTAVSLADYASRYGFDEAVAGKLVEDYKAKRTSTGDHLDREKTDDEACSIYKVFYKDNGIVYYCWYSKDAGDFLKKPEPFYNGNFISETSVDGLGQPTMTLVEATEVDYPFFTNFRALQEDKKMSAQVGRAETDFPLQEAITSLVSSVVNGCNLASSIQLVPDNLQEAGAPAQLDTKIKRGGVWNTPMRALNLPWPDPLMLGAIQSLTLRNAESNKQIAFSVHNRKDANKTAKEIGSAENKEQELQSTRLVVLSTALVPLFTAMWDIIRSQALVGAIVFCPDASGQNDIDLLSVEFNLAPAGDVDYIKRQEIIGNIQQDWPIVGSTVMGMPMLVDYIKLRYGDRAQMYLEAFYKGEADKTSLIMSLAGMVQQMATDEAGQLRPEFQELAPQLSQLQGVIQSVVGQPQQ